MWATNRTRQRGVLLSGAEFRLFLVVGHFFFLRGSLKNLNKEKKRKMPSRSKTRIVIPQEEPLEKEDVLFAVGLDLSHKSPGCAIYDILRNKWHICGFAQFVREEGFHQESADVEVRLLDMLPVTSTDVHKYMHVEKHLMKFLCDRIPQSARRNSTDVRIEQYVFSTAAKSGNNYKLHELGGVIKRALFVANFTHVTPVVPGQWKRTVVNKGNCGKIDVVHYVAKHGPCIDVLKMLGYDEMSLPLDEKRQIIVPTPSQDLADAVALALEAITQRLSIAKRKIEIDLEEKHNIELPPTKTTGTFMPIRKPSEKRRRTKFGTAANPVLPPPCFLEPTPQSKQSFWAA